MVDWRVIPPRLIVVGRNVTSNITPCFLHSAWFYVLDCCLYQLRLLLYGKSAKVKIEVFYILESKANKKTDVFKIII